MADGNGRVPTEEEITGAAPGAEEGITSEEFYALLDAFGISYPTTAAQVEDAAERLMTAMEELDALEAGFQRYLFDSQGMFPMMGTATFGTLWESGMSAIEEQRGVVASLAENFATLAMSKYGLAGAGPAIRSLSAVSALLRPPSPEIEKLLTPEEFMGNWSNAWASFSTGFTGLGTVEKEWLQGQKGQLYQEYLADLGKFAEQGMSPFKLREVERLLQPGAGEAERKAYAERGEARGIGPPGVMEEEFVTEVTPGGPGVPRGGKPTGTEITKSAAQQASEWAAKWGPGVPTEYAAEPRIMPADWLKGKLSEAEIRRRARAPTADEIRYARRQRGLGAERRPRVIGR